ncbi:MAG: YcnI family protein [Bdellovibrionia bacterium]
MSRHSMTLAVLLTSMSWTLISSAWAHVTLDPKAAPQGSYAKLTFRVPHGCDGAATTGITVLIPEGVVSVKPQVHPDWKISLQKRKLSKPVQLHGKDITESVSEVSWSGGPLPDEYMDEFGLSVKLPEKSDSPLAFPVIQKCKDKTVRWDMIAKPGQDAHSLPSPAPLLQLTSDGEHGSHSHH